MKRGIFTGMIVFGWALGGPANTASARNTFKNLNPVHQWNRLVKKEFGGGDVVGLRIQGNIITATHKSESGELNRIFLEWGWLIDPPAEVSSKGPDVPGGAPSAASISHPGTAARRNRTFQKKGLLNSNYFIESMHTKRLTEDGRDATWQPRPVEIFKRENHPKMLVQRSFLLSSPASNSRGGRTTDRDLIKRYVSAVLDKDPLLENTIKAIRIAKPDQAPENLPRGANFYTYVVTLVDNTQRLVSVNRRGRLGTPEVVSVAVSKQNVEELRRPGAQVSWRLLVSQPPKKQEEVQQVLHVLTP